MRDIDLAKELLEKEGYTLVIVKEGNVIYKSFEKGIKPMYTAVKEIKDNLSGASVADRVIGKAAAMLCRQSNIKELHTRLISESAFKVLDEGNIKYTYKVSSPYIKNRDKTDMCPVEKLSQETHDSTLLLEKIESFLLSIKKGV